MLDIIVPPELQQPKHKTPEVSYKMRTYPPKYYAAAINDRFQIPSFITQLSAWNYVRYYRTTWIATIKTKTPEISYKMRPYPPNQYAAAINDPFQIPPFITKSSAWTYGGYYGNIWIAGIKIHTYPPQQHCMSAATTSHLCCATVFNDHFQIPSFLTNLWATVPT